MELVPYRSLRGQLLRSLPGCRDECQGNGLFTPFDPENVPSPFIMDHDWSAVFKFFINARNICLGGLSDMTVGRDNRLEHTILSSLRELPFYGKNSVVMMPSLLSEHKTKA
jgi:hypothetical protein